MGKKRKAGRPTKYKPEMCAQVVELMREGASLAEVSAEIGITRETLNQWRHSNEKFSDAVKNGIELSRAWWERKGRVNLENKDFNATLWYMNMKNRHGWADKVEKKQETKIEIGWKVAPSLPDPTVIDAEIVNGETNKPELTEGEED